MSSTPTFSDNQIKAIARVLGDRLTGSEIGELFESLAITDPSPGTKRVRISDALQAQQELMGNGGAVISLVEAAMDPVQYAGRSKHFNQVAKTLNEILGFCGLRLADDGRVVPSVTSRNLTDAQERADRLAEELLRRAIHPDVLKHCSAELLVDDYFHAVHEATKSVAKKIRQRTGLTYDGTALVDEAFGWSKGPLRLAFNGLLDDNDRSEQRGLMNLLKGMFSLFRNTTAHRLRTSWEIDEVDAIDLLSLVSLLHKRLDAASAPPRTHP